MSGARDDLHAPFYAVRGRRVGLVLAVAQAVVLIGVSFALPSSGSGAFGSLDRIGMVLVAAAVGWVLWRLAQVAAWPDETGLRVRNLLFSRRLEWAQIVSVRFGAGQPWVTLDLSDGDTLAVMAIQRADGPAGQAQARRLATLVALHSRTAQDG